MRFIRQSFALIFALVAALSQDASAHSVAQVQTTKYFHPDTVSMLVNRALTGVPGFQVGDTVSYVIEFTPVPNSSNIGVQGYVSDYIPDGVEVIQASIVQKDAGGNFVDVAPDLPGLSYDGYGGRSGGFATFNAPFNSGATYTTGCAAYPGNNCNARSCELQADTGIFYSTNPRTAQFPLLPTRIVQGTAGNGYNIAPARTTQLNPIIGQTVATTHNLWDADQTNAFGSTAAAITALAAPKSAQTALVATRMGNTPYNAGSPVAGPQTGYQLDNTGGVGPWQRVSYSGSRMGDLSRGPATAMGAAAGAVCGFSTSTGWNLSPSNPLPSGTNAVRWAIGKLQVGQIKYVKISLRLTAPIPPAGLINASEVFGADTANDDPSAAGIATGDNAWLYHVPSVADNNANLLVLKTVVGYYQGATLIPSDGSTLPINAKVRYRIVYLNSGNATQTNVTLTDTLPCQTGANSVSNIAVVNGPIGVGMVAPVVAAGTAATNCTALGRKTFSFTPTVANLGPGMAGNIEFDVQLAGMAAATLYNVPNTAKLVSTEIPAGVTSSANATVPAVAPPNLIISKTTSTPSVAAGGTATYTITVTNNGTAAATGINVYDFLPSTGGANNALTRFSYAAAGTTTGLTPVVPVLSVPPTLSPYTTGGVSTNQQQVRWNFGAQSLAVGASATITYSATVGASVPSTVAPYYSSEAVVYTGGVGRDDAINVAPVTVDSALSVTASIDSYWDVASATWVTYSNSVPANAKVRYRLDYTNTGAIAIAGANIANLLPCQTGANSVSNIVIASGPIVAPAPNPPVIAAGNCATGTRQTFSFTAGTIAAGQSGSITIDVQTNAANGNIVTNTATLSAAGAASSISEVQSTVQSAPMIAINKSASVTGAKAGDTVSYTLTVTNNGTANATNLAIYDWLPAGGAALNPATRFSFVTGSSVFGGSITGVTPTLTTPPPSAIPFNTNVNAANMHELAWDFGAQTLAPGASFTITYNATIGASVPLGTYGHYGRAYSANTALTGTITATLGSATVAGAGTSFLTQLSVGNLITIAGVNYTVSAIANATSLTLTKVYAGATAGGLVISKKSSQANSNVASLDVSAAVADVAVTMTNGVTTLISGTATSYSIVVTNNGPDAADGTKIFDPLASGLSKMNVSCSASGGASCPLFSTVPALEGSGINISSFPSGGSIVLTVTADVTATGGSVTNSAFVGLPTGMSDGNWSNNLASDTDTIIASDLSTSTKTWVDTNGGDHNQGDVLTYTITLTESGGVAATGVSVADDLSTYLGNLVVNSIPAGANDNSNPAGGVNATGLVDISNITVPANGSVSIVFSATIAVAAPNGGLINNTATVTNPSGAGGAPSASSVSVGSPASTGTKALYLYGSDAATGTVVCAAATPCKMSRVVTPNVAPSNTNVTIGRGSIFTWNLTPVLQSAVTISPLVPATVPVTLNLSTTNTRTYNVLVELYCSNAVPVAPAPISLTQAIALTNGAASAPYTFNLPLAAATTCPVGSAWVLRVTNSGGVNAARTVIVTPVSAVLAASKVSLPSQDVINVNSVTSYNAAYPAVTTSASYVDGNTVYVRAVVSDPFGSFDITSANITIKDSNNVTKVAAAAMTMVADSGAATKTFEYAYTIPVGAAGGGWTATVTANEGTEGTVTHNKSGGFTVYTPTADLEVTINNGVTAVAAGGTTTYTIVVTNHGPDSANGTKIKDLAVAGLSKTNVTCNSSSFSCPVVYTLADLEGAGITLNPLASGDTVTLTVTADVTALSGTVTNTATAVLPGGMYDPIPATPLSVSDTDDVVVINLTTSTKSWVDNNIGTQEPGDIITYTITLNETSGAAATNANVTDPIPASMDTLTVLSMPPGATNSSTASFLDIRNITVPANGSVDVIFSVRVGMATPIGTVVRNMATVTVPNGYGSTPESIPFVVGTPPSSGMKALYLYGAAAAPYSMSRVPNPGTAPDNTLVTVLQAGSETWSLSPLLQLPVTLDPTIFASVPVMLMTSVAAPRTVVKAELYCSSSVPAVGFAPIQASTIAPDVGANQMNLYLPIGAVTAANLTCAAGNSWVLRVSETSNLSNVEVTPVGSTIMLPTQTIISVNSLTAYSVPYTSVPNTTTATAFGGGSTVYLRAVVSDPFGSFDITSSEVSITDSVSAARLTAAAMTMVADSAVPPPVAPAVAATKIYEYAYTIPVGALGGTWNVSVTSKEGTEAVISHTRTGSFEVLPPIDHYEITMTGTSIACQPTTVTVIACRDSANPCTVATEINSKVTISTSGGVLTPTTTEVPALTGGEIRLSGGQGTSTLSYPLAPDNTDVTVSFASVTDAAVVNPVICAGGAAARCIATTTFNTAGFIFSALAGGAVTTILPQVAGVSDGTYYLRSVKTNTITKACEGALSGLNPVKFAYECNDPSSCAGSDLMKVNGTPIGTNNSGVIPGLSESYIDVNMTFDTNGNAPFTFIYSDVGQVKLYASKAAGGSLLTDLSGLSNAFVVAPHHFEITAKCTIADADNCGAGALAMATAGDNPAAANAAGASFIPAGAQFTVTVTAKNAAGATTPNFGLESTPEVVSMADMSNAVTCVADAIKSCLVAPASGTAGTLSGGTIATTATKDMFGNWDVRTGAVESTSASWNEVGIIKLRADNTTYLGSSKNVTGLSGNVGRFYPHHFITTVTAPMNCTGLIFGAPCPGNGLVYSGQAFTTAVFAMNASATPAQTLNYAYSAIPANNFARQVTLSAVAAFGGGAHGTGALIAEPLIPSTTMADSRFSLGSGTLNTPIFTFTATPTTPTDAFVRAEDSETSSLRTVPTDSVEGGLKVVSGRIRVSNAHGSEQLALPMTATVQYYVGPGWVKSKTDTNVTSFSTATNIVAAIIKGPLVAGDVSVSNPGTVYANEGVFPFRLAKPSVAGSADISINAPAYLPSVPGRATFGVYRGNNEFIYLREAY